ncbi:MAG: MFS transporter [Ilumatobacteraceae bacterium]
MPPAGRPPKPSPLVIAGYVAYMAVGWYLSGIGSVLPELEDEIGGVSAAYPLLPGTILLVWGLVRARRQHRAHHEVRYAEMVTGSVVGLAAMVVVMGVTSIIPLSVVGAVAAAVAAAALIRLLPATFAVARPDDTERVMVRANAWSSLASISSPLVIGATIGLGIGWLPGMSGPIALAAVVTGLAVRRAGRTVAVAPDDTVDAASRRRPVPPFRHWGRAWAVVTVGIVVEFCFAYYAATFLHDEVGMSIAAAAAGASAWGVGMAIGRFALSVRTPPRSFTPTFVLVMIGFVLLWGIATPASAIIGIGIAGIGVSPLYPTRMTALLAKFPESPDQGSTRGGIASGAALLVAPALMASLRALSDVRTAYLAVPVLLVVLALLDRGRAIEVRPARES